MLELAGRDHEGARFGLQLESRLSAALGEQHDAIHFVPTDEEVAAEAHPPGNAPRIDFDAHESGVPGDDHGGDPDADHADGNAEDQRLGTELPGDANRQADDHAGRYDPGDNHRL